MSNTDLDETRLTAALHELAGRASPTPDALEAVRTRHARNRRNRARLRAAGGGALVIVIALTAVSVTRLGGDTELTSTGPDPTSPEGQGAPAADPHLPAFVSLKWMKPGHIGLYEGAPGERPDRWVQSSYMGDDGRSAQLIVEHSPAATPEEKASERDGDREEITGPRGGRVILVSDRGRYWGFWTEGEWHFELSAGAIPTRGEALEILQSVVVDAARFEELKLALRDAVSVVRPGTPTVESVVASGRFGRTEWRATELVSSDGQRCLGLEPGFSHRWFCLPADAEAFTGGEPNIRPGQKTQLGDYWMYAALVDNSTSVVRVHAESAGGIRHTVDLAPAPLRDGTMGVAVGFLPTTLERITTEFVDADGTVTYTTTQSLSGG